MKAGFKPFLVAVILGTGFLGCQGCGGSTAMPSKQTLNTEDAVVDKIPAMPSTSTWKAPKSEVWDEVNRLEEEQKFQAALEKIKEIEIRAIDSQDSVEIVRSLIRRVFAEGRLGRWEDGVEHLIASEQSWPEDLLSRATLSIYLGSAIRQYLAWYGYEISRRPEMAEPDEADLKTWSAARLSTRALHYLGQVWAWREALRTVKTDLVSEFISPATYPEKVRGTLADAVAYMMAEMLADSSVWTAAESNSVWTLDVEDLNSKAARASTGMLAASTHPLEKMAFVLKDLEFMKERDGLRDGALEARLSLVRMIAAHAPEGAGWTEKLIAALATRLQKETDHDWWSEGMYVLAWMTGRLETDDALTKAVGIARECCRAKPDSTGAARCRNLEEEWTRPEISLFTAAASFPVNGPFRTAANGSSGPLSVKCRNIDHLWFRAWKSELGPLLEEKGIRTPDGELINRFTNGKKFKKPDFEWDTAVRNPGDFRQFEWLVKPPFVEPGAYIVQVSGRAGFPETDNVIRTLLTFPGGPVVTAEKDYRKDETQFRVLDGLTGNPIENAVIRVYRFSWDRHEPPRTLLSRSTTDEEGHVSVKIPPQDYRQTAGYVDVDGRTYPITVPDMFGRWDNDAGHEEIQTVIFTDRSIYRPGQKIDFKVIAFGRTESEKPWTVSKKESVFVQLLDANGESVGNVQVTTNEWGSASGSFTIPEGRLLGAWSVTANYSGRTGIRVEEYRVPAFTVDIDNPQGLRLNKPASVRGSATYSFGLPVTGAKVAWKIERRPVWSWWFGYGPTNPQVIASGLVRTDDKGVFNVDFTAAADERAKAGNARPDFLFRLSADITDEAGETRTESRDFTIGYSAVRAAASTEDAFIEPGNPVPMNVTRTDVNGNPAQGPVEWRLVRIKKPDQPILPLNENPFGDLQLSPRIRESYSHDGGPVPYDPVKMIRSWPDGGEINKGKVETDVSGKGRIDLGPLEPGLYRFRMAATDQYGETFEDFTDLNIVGEGSQTDLPMLMSVQKKSYEVGETVRLAIGSSFRDQFIVLEMFDRSGMIEQRLVRTDGGSKILTFKVDRKARGGLFFRAISYRLYQNLSLTAGVDVPWSDRVVNVSVERIRDRVTPGGRETVALRVSEPENRSGIPSAEILAWMYDKSLDELAPFSPPDLMSIWPRASIWLALHDSLREAQQIWVANDGFTRIIHIDEDFEPDSLIYIPQNGRMLHRGYRMGGGGSRMLPASATSRNLTAGFANTASFEMDEESVTDKIAEKRALAAPGPTAAEQQNQEAAPPAPARKNFAETAFFLPHLTTGPDGSVKFEYTVPDSVTTWKMLAYASTKDLRSGHTETKVLSARNLMVKPFLPRFLREGDSASVTAVVANTTDKSLSGSARIDIEDPSTGRNLNAEFGLNNNTATFTSPAGGETTVRFDVAAPSRPGSVAFRITATSGNETDGEIRPVPVLPGRWHLVQSRFATLHAGKAGSEVRQLSFPDMKLPDPTRINDKMVITVDGQLFMSVLSALPYLVEYPYECAEQTMNRFVSTGILTSLFAKNPSIAAWAKRASARKTQYEKWDADDPNRKLSLEETPWLEESRGGRDDRLQKILDPQTAIRVQTAAIAKLRAMQHADGAFPWFPGGPPSGWMTLYVVAGLSRAMEFEVDVPQDIMQSAMGWTHRWYLQEKARRNAWIDEDWATATFLAWILSNLPERLHGGFTDSERKELLDLGFENWKKMSAGTKSMLTMALHRAGRKADAKLVWDSVMDSARREKDRGMFWAQEDRSWLWYNDTIENHARAIRTLEEINPESDDIDDLVLWLFINKNLNHWKSTRATAEVIYALARHLSARGEIGGREVVSVKAGPVETKFVFDPAQSGLTTARKVIEGSEIDEKTMSDVTVRQETKGWALASATWHFSTEKMPEKGDGDLLSIDRKYFVKRKTGSGSVLVPFGPETRVEPGEEVEVQISIKSGAGVEYVHLRDPRPAGFEPAASTSSWRWGLGISWYEEVRDSGENFFFEKLPRGEYTFRYSIRAAFAGKFKAAPATIQPMYAPEFAAYSSGSTVTVSGR